MSFSVSSGSIIFQGDVIDSPVRASFMIVVCYRAHGRHVKSPVAQSGHTRLRSCHKLVAVGRELYFALAWTIGPLSSSDLTSWRVLYQESISQLTWIANVFVAWVSRSQISGPFCNCFTTSLF